MRNVLFRCFLLAALPLGASAQHFPTSTLNAGTGSNLSDQMLIQDSKRAMSPAETVIEGSPYLSPSFAPALVKAKGGVFRDVPARYNACDDNLEYQQRGVTYVVMPSESIKLVQFTDYSLVVDQLSSRDSSYAFFIRLDSGKATLLLRKPIDFKEGQAPKALEGDGRPPQYVAKRDEFYIKLGTDLPRQFSNVKKLIGLLPDHRPEMEKFVSANNVARTAEDLKKVVAFYNSL